MNTTITEAIAQRMLLELTYHGERRTVEPHIYGIDTKGHDALLTYQVTGAKTGWRMLHVSEIHGLIITNNGFSGPRGRGNAKQFSQVFIHV